MNVTIAETLYDGGWLVVEYDDSRDVHIMPCNDVVRHHSRECVCGPRTEPVEREDGSIDFLVIHASLDGRESREDKPS